MSNGAHPYIAREGWLFIGALVVSAFMAKFYFGLLASLPLWLLCGLVAYLFRDPQREIPAAPLGIVSPADGSVLSVDKVHDHYLGREAIKILMRMNPLGSYVTRAPIEGKIVKHWFPPAQADTDKDEEGLGHYAMWLQTDEDDSVVLQMEMGCKRLKPSCYHQTGERIGQGERCGLMRFGGLVELLLPANTRVEVSAGDQVVAGSTLLAMLIHPVVPCTKPRGSNVVQAT